MAVNSMTKEQAYQLINAIHTQATGQVAITPTDLSSFISVAQATLAVGTDAALNAITQVLQRTIVAVRPYDEKFKGLQMSSDEWGGIIRKINFADREALPEPSYLLSGTGEQDAVTEGESVDQYKVRKPKVLETRFVGSNIWKGQYTVYRKQIKTAFSNESEFSVFITGLMTHMVNERTQWLENVKRSLLANAIATKKEINDSSVIHLLTEYNALTLQSLTITDIYLPANFKPFMEWAYSRVQQVSRLFTERSGLFQQTITGYPIMRHTPVNDQRVYMSADFLGQMSAMVLADTYHDNFLRYADVEPVSFWQAINDPLKVSATPVYIDSTGAVKTGSAQVVDKVVGIMFDRDALGYNIIDNSVESSPYNSDGQYYNLFQHVDIQLQFDPSEKIAVFLLD